MGLTRNIRISVLESEEEKNIIFYNSQNYQEISLVEIQPETVPPLYVHRAHTDQLLVVRGSLVVIILQNRCYQYIPLHSNEPKIIEIPPGIPHTAVNLNLEPCCFVNIKLRHDIPHKLDYRPLKPPLDYDFDKMKSLLNSSSNSNS